MIPIEKFVDVIHETDVYSYFLDDESRPDVPELETPTQDFPTQESAPQESAPQESPMQEASVMEMSNATSSEECYDNDNLNGSMINITNKKWLEYPEFYIKPPRMCSVNKYVQCVSKDFSRENHDFVPFGPEMVFLGSDTPSLPNHLMKWVWVLNCINSLQIYEKCLYPVEGMTKLRYKKDNDRKTVTGVARRSETNQTAELPADMRFFHGFGGSRQVSYAQRVLESTRNEFDATGPTFYYRNMRLCEMSWEVLPMKYFSLVTDMPHKRIFHVLRTIPAPGFDLMGCFASMELVRLTKWKNNITYDDILKVTSEVLNCEANTSLGINGGFNREGRIPSPMDVHREIHCMMNGYLICSPFLLCEKISRRLDLATVSDLRIDGFPPVSTRAEQCNCDRIFTEISKDYDVFIRAFGEWLHNHALMSNEPKKTAKKPVNTKNAPKKKQDVNDSLDQDDVAEQDHMQQSRKLEEIVQDFWGNVLEFRCNWTSLHMVFNLQSWCDGVSADKCENLRCPQLTIATMTPFQYIDDSENTNFDSLSFIQAHLGDQQALVNETAMMEKYGKDSTSWGDLPHACMFRTSRDALRTSLKTVYSDSNMEHSSVDLLSLIQVYRNYIHAQATIHTQAIAADLMMSDRVLYSSQCLEKITLDINRRMAQMFKVKSITGEFVQQKICTMFHPDYAFFVDLMHILSFNNQYIRANPINLSVLWAFMMSDVLTHLGSHHETWTWMMYTVNVLGGCGHLRATTDDHASRVPVLFTSKPNSVGFNAIITRMMKHMVNFISELVPDVSSECLEAMRYMKLDRTTRAGVEGVSSVLFVNGVKEQAPCRRMFMRNMIMDEGYRSLDVSALNGLVCSIPRDSDGGSGNILKTVDPGNKGGAHMQGHQKQIPGLSPFLIGLTSNSNPHSAPIGESIKSLAVVAANFPPGAQPGGHLASVRGRNAHRLHDYVPCTTNSASSLPQDKEEREVFAWTMSVVWMASRQLALINKTGQIDFELSVLQVKYTEWVRNLMSYIYMSMFGAVLFPSYDRVIAGYIARQVASTFIATATKNICTQSSMAEANAATLMDMETSPLTIQSLNVALGNAMMHLVDMNLILVHQFFRDELQTPYIPLLTLREIFEKRAFNHHKHPEVREALRTFLMQILDRNSRNGDTFNCGYYQSTYLANAEDYMQKEAYLESYCGITKGNYFTYAAAFRECLSKKFDLLSLLDMTEADAKIGRLFEVAGIAFDENTFNKAVANNKTESTQGSYVMIALGENKQIQNVYVNLLQHVVLCSIFGEHELHSDNVFHLGANIFQLFLQRASPAQNTPFGSAIYEQFVQNKNDVVPMRVMYEMKRRPDYFLRAVHDRGMEQTGEVTELPRQIANHPPEDTVHLTPWLRLHSILFSGKFADNVFPFPRYNGRTPELVPGRIYPIMAYRQHAMRNIDDATDDRLHHYVSGTVCVCPQGEPRVVLYFQNEKSCRVYGLDAWSEVIEQQHIVVAPLIFRAHALVRMGESKMGIIVRWDAGSLVTSFDTLGLRNPDGLKTAGRRPDTAAESAPPRTKACRSVQRQCDTETLPNIVCSNKQYLSKYGEYRVRICQSINGQDVMFDEKMHFSWVHRNLVGLGSPMLILLEHLDQCKCYSYGDATHLKCFLRYPEGLPNYSKENLAYVSFRVNGPNKLSTIHVQGFPFQYLYSITDLGEQSKKNGSDARKITDHVILTDEKEYLKGLARQNEDFDDT
jgi:hypothetical protein